MERLAAAGIVLLIIALLVSMWAVAAAVMLLALEILGVPVPDLGLGQYLVMGVALMFVKSLITRGGD